MFNGLIKLLLQELTRTYGHLLYIANRLPLLCRVTKNGHKRIHHVNVNYPCPFAGWALTSFINVQGILKIGNLCEIVKTIQLIVHNHITQKRSIKWWVTCE